MNNAPPQSLAPTCEDPGAPSLPRAKIPEIPALPRSSTQRSRPPGHLFEKEVGTGSSVHEPRRTRGEIYGATTIPAAGSMAPRPSLREAGRARATADGGWRQQQLLRRRDQWSRDALKNKVR